MERRVLHVDGHHMFSRRRKRLVPQCGNGRLEVGMLRELSILQGIEGPLQAVDVGRDLDSAGQESCIAVRAFEFRQAAESKVHLGDRPVHAVMLKLLQEARLQILRIDKSEQRALRIGVRDGRSGVDLITIGEDDSSGRAVLHLDTYYFARCPNLRSGFFRCRSHRRRERAHSSHNVGGGRCRISIRRTA